MKTVCIVGAGPGGLTAAKTLLQTGQFQVTVYEKNERVGGIWALDRNSVGTFLSGFTPTNLSRFTVSFSDLDWNSIDLSESASGSGQNGYHTKRPPPMFPKAWMANRYLEEYRRRYVPDSSLRLGRTVTRAHRLGSTWQVTTEDGRSGVDTQNFDYLILASGFFSRPRLLQHNVPSFQDVESVKIIHSSAFRRLDDILPPSMDRRGKKILMLGGGNSSGETAAAVAMQLSNARWSPDSALHTAYRDFTVVHVTPRPFYPIPPFNEYAEASRSYVPLDLKLYDLARRPKGMPAYGGLASEVVRDTVHGMMQTMVGGDQSDISDALVAPKYDNRGAPYVALTEGYSEFVRSGLINAVRGRVTNVKDDGKGTATATVQNGDETFELDGVAAVIYATGYTPCPAIDILDDDTKAALRYDPTSMRLPLILEQWQTMNRKVPSLSLIGFYEGPYWPMMEMQARLTANRWLTGELAPFLNDFEKPDVLLLLRKAFDQRSVDATQFWFGDYTGYLLDIAKHLQLTHNDNGFAEREGCISPARFQADGMDITQANQVMRDLHETWNSCLVHGRYVPRAVFRALQGSWTIDRQIQSAISTLPSGTLQGTASFHPRTPTVDKSGKVFDFEYLYVEAGDFTTSAGHKMTASRRYVYRYCEDDDELSVWFVKPDNILIVDYHFHTLSFLLPEEARHAGASIAKANHLCVEDNYETEYRIPMQGVSLRSFEVIHKVKGPHKDYVSTTLYKRLEK